jgi:hypothetical protein
LSDGVQASSFSFSRLRRASLFGSRARKPIVLPSADHSKAETAPGADVSGSASPPSGRISQSWRLASAASSPVAPGRGRSDRNAR